MTELRWDVYLLGAPQPGVEASALAKNLANAFKKDISSIEKMLAQSRTLVKADVDATLAGKYKTLIEGAGGQCELSPREMQTSLQSGAPQAAATASASNQTPAANPASEKLADAACYCVKCGTLIRFGQKKCPKCFTSVTEYSAKNKTLAGFLAFFLGGWGIHRLYLGQWWGVFYLLFWMTLIPSIVSIVEAVIFWSTAQKTWDEKYGRVEKSSGVMIAVLIGGFFLFTTITGILAAVALPAYQDYTTRAKIESARQQVDELKNKVAVYILKNHSYPSDNRSVDFPVTLTSDTIEYINIVDAGKVEVAYKIKNLGDKNTIIWTPLESAGKVTWSCKEGSLLDRYRPKDCRGGNNTSDNSASAKANESIILSKKLFSEDKTISIKVPEAWVVNNGLADTALIGANHGTQGYLAVFSESKADFDNISLDAYTQAIQTQLGKNIDKLQLQGESRSLVIEGLAARQFVFTGTTQNINLGYVVTIVESDDTFYRLLGWSTQSQLEKNKALFASIGESLRLNK